MPKTVKIYSHLLQLCIVNHRLFFPGHGVQSSGAIEFKPNDEMLNINAQNWHL